MSTIPNEVLSWKFGGKSGNVCSQNSYETNTGYSLQCVSNNEYLSWGKQNLGINLVFMSQETDKKIHFVLPDNQERAILTGEAVAFGIGGGDSFLAYAERSVGINLEWRSEPSYEWRLFDASGEKGKLVPTGAQIAMINVNVKPEADFMIYLERPGADVGWTSSPGWIDRIIEVGGVIKSSVEIAQLVIAVL
jgi:hypothetical protein